jgi:hypothetical protein
MKLGKYKHYKGKYYQVLGVATHSENKEELVIYKALYDEDKLFARPKAMFEENVMIEGKEIPRFKFNN